MMKHFFLGIIIICSLISCRTVHHTKTIIKTSTPIDTTISIIDTNKIFVIDSTLYAKHLLKELESKNFIYKSFYSKIKMSYDDGIQNQNTTAYIHILKDSLIWISINGPLNIEVGRMLISKDSVKIINKFEKIAMLRSINYLQNVTSLPIDFKTIQAIIIGQPFFINNILDSFKSNENIVTLYTKYNDINNTMEVDTATKNI